MIDRRVYPDVFAYNALIKGYVLTSDAKKAFKTFNNVSKNTYMYTCTVRMGWGGINTCTCTCI